MHYPWWHVPFLTAPMLIAAIAVLHVFVSMYAVGGGMFLAAETGFARREGRRDYLGYLKDHAKFFILLTVVYGAITGVGIWWTIGLASPVATEALIHAFVFGWAMEYVFFAIEVVAAFVFYYFWDRLPPRTHVQIGWIYAGAAWISLVLITGITAFMLHPGRWPENHGFWTGFLNPQFLPQTIARTGGALLLASLYVYLHASFRLKGDGLLEMIGRRSARPGLLGAALVTLGGLWWYAALPDSAQAALVAAAPLNILMSIIFAVTAIVFVMLYLGPYRRPGWVSPGFSILLFSFGLAAVGTGEFIREAVRKPYIVYDVVWSNQIYKDELMPLRERGYLEGGVWTRAWVARRYPQAVSWEGAAAWAAGSMRTAGTAGTLKIDERSLLELPPVDRKKVGEVLFQYHCNDCHASTAGLSAVAHLTRGWSEEMIRLVVEHPERAHFFMPPWAGTPEEAALLQEYLAAISEPFPKGLPDLGGPPGQVGRDRP